MSSQGNTLFLSLICCRFLCRVKHIVFVHLGEGRGDGGGGWVGLVPPTLCLFNHAAVAAAAWDKNKTCSVCDRHSFFIRDHDNWDTQRHSIVVIEICDLYKRFQIPPSWFVMAALFPFCSIIRLAPIRFPFKELWSFEIFGETLPCFFVLRWFMVQLPQRRNSFWGQNTYSNILEIQIS